MVVELCIPGNGDKHKASNIAHTIETATKLMSQVTRRIQSVITEKAPCYQ